MSEYINREMAASSIVLECDDVTLEQARQAIKDVPSADVVEVRHGKWSHDYIKDGVEYNDWLNLHCTVCGETQRDAWGKWSYCPYCGAKMDEKEQENG